MAEVDQSSLGLRLDGGMTLGSWGEMRLGLLRGKAKATTTVGVEWVPDQGTSRLGALVYDLHVDTLDKRLFASTGTLGHLSVNHSSTGLGADFDYTFASFNVQQVYTNGANVWTLILRGGSNLGTEVPVYDQFRLGGLFNLSGFRQNELVGQEYGLASAQYRRRIGWLDKTDKRGSCRARAFLVFA